MNKAMVSGLAVAVAFVAAGAVYVAVPRLRTAEDVVQRQVREGTERARRLFAKVGRNEERLAQVLDGLRAAGVEQLDADQIKRLVEDDREMLAGAEERLGQIVRTVRPRRQRLMSDLLMASQLPPPALEAGFGRNVPQMTGAIREGLAARERLLRENDAVLEEALHEVRQALSAQQGNVSGGENPDALRLRGIILSAQGTVFQRQAVLVRHQAAARRAELALSAAALARWTTEQSVVADSGIEARIEDLREQERGKVGELRTLESRTEKLRATVRELEAQLAEQQAIAEAARQALDALVNDDQRWQDADSVEVSAVQYSEQAAIYREALGRAHILERGTLDNAVIDVNGDLASGRYVPAEEGGSIETRWGLHHYRDELAVLEAQEVQFGQALALLREALSVMRKAQTALARRAEDSATRVQAMRTEMAVAYAALTDLLDEAWTLEDRAIEKVEGAVSSFRQAARATETRQREASEAMAAKGSRASRSAPEGMFAEDRWRPASDDARAAEAKLLLASIHYTRFRELVDDAATLEGLGETLPEGADPHAMAEQAEEARLAGLELAEAALDGLFSAARDMKQHFALAAEIAGAYDLLSQLGDPTAARAAIYNYEAAIDGRKDSPYVTQYVERLAQLRRLRASSRK